MQNIHIFSFNKGERDVWNSNFIPCSPMQAQIKSDFHHADKAPKGFARAVEKLKVNSIYSNLETKQTDVLHDF